MTQIEKLQYNLQNCRDTIIYKGGTVGDTTGFNHLAKEIETIPAGNPNYVYVEDNTVAYEKQIMAGALPKAKLKELGGMTYKSNNLFRFPYSDTSNTNNGITWTVNEDGSITANGTATAMSTFSLIKTSYFDASADIGDVYFSGSPAGGGDDTYYIYCIATGHKETGSGRHVSGFKGSYARFEIRIVSGYTANNLVFKPMLNYGTTALPYEPYYEGLRDTKPTAIINHGANLTDEITVNPSAQINLEVYRELPLLMGAGTYTISFSTKIYWQGHSTNVTRITGTTNANVFVFSINDDEPAWVRFRDGISSSTPWDYNTTIMVNVGSTAFPYVPHREDVEIFLPKEVTSWSEWGKGIPGYANTYDFVNGRYIQRVYTQVMTGRQYWWEYGTGTDAEKGKYCYACDPTYFSGLAKVGNFQSSVCNTYNNVNAAFNAANTANQVGNYSDTTGYPNVYFVTDKPTVEEWRAHLTALEDAGTPVLLTYALAEPIITDGPIYPNTLDVEGGCILEFVNEYNYPVPSTITYLRRTV